MATENDLHIELLKDIVGAHERTAAELRRLADHSGRLEAEIEKMRGKVSRIETLWGDQQASSSARMKLFEGFAKSTPVQLLLMGMVVAVLQILGVAWVASSYLPPGEVQRPAIHIEGTP